MWVRIPPRLPNEEDIMKKILMASLIFLCSCDGSRLTYSDLLNKVKGECSGQLYTLPTEGGNTITFKRFICQENEITLIEWQIINEKLVFYKTPMPILK